MCGHKVFIGETFSVQIFGNTHSHEVVAVRSIGTLGWLDVIEQCLLRGSGNTVHYMLVSHLKRCGRSNKSIERQVNATPCRSHSHVCGRIFQYELAILFSCAFLHWIQRYSWLWIATEFFDPFAFIFYTEPDDFEWIKRNFDGFCQINICKSMSNCHVSALQ